MNNSEEKPWHGLYNKPVTKFQPIRRQWLFGVEVDVLVEDTEAEVEDDLSHVVKLKETTTRIEFTVRNTKTDKDLVKVAEEEQQIKSTIKITQIQWDATTVTPTKATNQPIVHTHVIGGTNQVILSPSAETD